MAVLLGVLLLVGVTVVHEAGHWLAVRLKRGIVHRVRIGWGAPIGRWQGPETEIVLSLLPVGGRIHYEGIGPGTPQAVVAVSGSVANLVAAFFLFALSLPLLDGQGVAPQPDGEGGTLVLAAVSVGAWFWMIPGAVAELVTAGRVVELDRGVGALLALVRDGGLPAVLYAGGGLSAIWAALNLIPVPGLDTDGWLAARALWRGIRPGRGREPG